MARPDRVFPSALLVSLIALTLVAVWPTLDLRANFQECVNDQAPVKVASLDAAPAFYQPITYSPGYLAREAELIVVGRARDVGAAELSTPSDPIERPFNMRDVLVDIEQTLRGRRRQSVTVRVTAESEFAIDRYTFLPCERAVFFLHAYQDLPWDSGQRGKYAVDDKYRISAKGTVMDGREAPPVPLQDFLRFVRSAVALGPAPKPQLDASGRLACPEVSSAPSGQVTSIRATRRGVEVVFTPGTIQWPQLASSVEGILATAQPSKLRVGPQLRQHGTYNDLIEIGLAETPQPGWSAFQANPVRLALNSSLTGRAEVIDPGAPPGSLPLEVTDQCALNALELGLGRAFSLGIRPDGSSAGPLSGVVVAAQADRLVALTREEGILSLLIDPSSAILNRRPRYAVLGGPLDMRLTPTGSTPPRPWPLPRSWIGSLDAEQLAARGPLDCPGIPREATHPPCAVEVIRRSPRPGDLVSIEARPDLYVSGVGHVYRLDYGEFSPGQLARHLTSADPAPRWVEYEGQVFVPYLGASNELESYLEPTGKRVAIGGGSTYGTGLELLRLKDESFGETFVLRLPSDPDARAALGRNFRAFRRAETPGSSVPNRIVSGQTPYAFERPSGCSDCVAEYRGETYVAGPLLGALGLDDLELVERLSASNDPNYEVAFLEIYRWKEPRPGEDLLINRVFKSQLLDYEILIGWFPHLSTVQ